MRLSVWDFFKLSSLSIHGAVASTVPEILSVCAPVGGLSMRRRGLNCPPSEIGQCMSSLSLLSPARRKLVDRPSHDDEALQAVLSQVCFGQILHSYPARGSQKASSSYDTPTCRSALRNQRSVGPSVGCPTQATEYKRAQRFAFLGPPCRI